MVIVSDQVLKTFFQTGDKPTSSQFGALIDSMVNKLDDAQLLGLRVYDNTRIYTKGDTAIYNFVIYECTGISTTGTFQANDWKTIAGGTVGGITYRGTWDAITNTPDLLNSDPVTGDYYVVAVSGDTNLDGISSWYLSDWAIYNGEVWQKINNSRIVNDQQLSLKFASSSEEVSQNDTTDFETKLSLVFEPEVTGSYLVQWYFELGSTKETTQMEAKVEVNGVKEAEVMRISQHGLVTQFDSASGMFLKDMDDETAYEVTIQYRKRVNGTPPEEFSCRIRRARLVIMKA
jgi:hypothetical protein